MYYKEFVIFMIIFAISIAIICVTATTPISQLACLNIIFIAALLFMDMGGGDE